MSYYIRLLGGGLLLILSLFVSRGYSAYKDRRIAEAEGFIGLIAHIEGKISGFLSHGASLWQGFSDASLEQIGFLQKLKEGVTLSEAFSLTKAGLSLDCGTRERLREYFNTFGRGYREDELRRASCCREALEADLKKAKEELEKNVKAVRVLLLGGSLGIIILLL